MPFDYTRVISSSYNKSKRSMAVNLKEMLSRNREVLKGFITLCWWVSRVVLGMPCRFTWHGCPSWCLYPQYLMSIYFYPNLMNIRISAVKIFDFYGFCSHWHCCKDMISWLKKWTKWLFGYAVIIRPSDKTMGPHLSPWQTTDGDLVHSRLVSNMD